MPTSQILPEPHEDSADKSPTSNPNFSGQVQIEAIHGDKDVAIAKVTFSPATRTRWHTHERGQLLRVTEGTGWICDEGGKPRRLNVGDTVWAPPGTTHWHGADDASAMSHFSAGLGETKWAEPVTEEEYGKKA